jgi:SpoVK/Ycf46/Vps4 family AAA+-type ATPase
MLMDLVRGKGKGVIILLHGVPEVGKTSTAECVAFHLGRPLFPITYGDLGVDANTVELRLEEYFRLASQWGCVLLLDEADVFLARRSEDQLKRNALVSGKKTMINSTMVATN